MKKFIAWLTVACLLPSAPALAVVGGEVVPQPPAGQPLPYPWMGSIQFNDDTECGGTLVAPEYIVTAAHCFFNNSTRTTIGDPVMINGVNVRLGSLNKRDPNAEVIPIAQVIIHPDYRKANGAEVNDIALIRLSRPSQNRNFIRLTTVEVAPGQVATVLGWGLYDQRNQLYSDQLRRAELPIVSRQVCQQRLQDVYGQSINSSMICAGLDQGGPDACIGDSGGPLFIQDARGQYVQLGIVSFGVSCGRPRRPGVYSNVAELYSFITTLIARATATATANPSLNGGSAVVAIPDLEATAATPNQAAVARSLDRANVTQTDALTAIYIDLFLAPVATRRRALESLMPRNAFGQMNLSQSIDRTIANQIRDRTERLQSNPTNSASLQAVDISGLSPTGKLPALLPQFESSRAQGESRASPIPAFDSALGASSHRVALVQPKGSASGLGSPNPAEAESSPRRWNVFAAGTIDTGDIAQQGNAERADTTFGTATVGVDYRIAPGTFAGLALSYGHGEISERNLSNLEGNSLGISLYGTTQFGRGGYVTGYAGYRWNEYETRRAIYLPQDILSAKADVQGRQWSTGVDLGWRFRSGRLSFGPSARFRHSRTIIEDYTESGVDAISLKVDGRNQTSSRGNLDFNLSYIMPQRWGSITPSLRFSLEHEFSATRQTVSASFVDAPLFPFQINSRDVDRTWLVINPGVLFQVGERAFLGLSYQTDLLRSNASNHSFSALFRLNF
jgi:uncharacterized protein YhjY with autotransporter beta-barrel domain